MSTKITLATPTTIQDTGPVSASRSSTTVAPPTMPAATGRSPVSIAACHSVPRYLFQTRPAKKQPMQAGTNSASVATSAPARPATFQPISVVIIDPGPGVTRAMANISRNSRAVSQ